MFLNVARRAARQNVLGQALEMFRCPPDFLALVETNSSDWGIEARLETYTRVATAMALGKRDTGLELYKHDVCPYLVDTVLQGRGMEKWPW